MSKTQLAVLWVGIGILVLMGLYPPGTRGGYSFIVNASSVSPGRLMIEWAIVALVTGGLIYTLKMDPDLLLKIPCRLSFFFGFAGLSYQDRLAEAKKDKTNIIGFWAVVVVLLVIGLIAVRLRIPIPGGLPRR